MNEVIDGLAVLGTGTLVGILVVCFIGLYLLYLEVKDDRHE